MYDQSQSPLFALPTELRLEIYSLALTSSELIRDPSWKLDRENRSNYRSSPPLGQALYATCRRINDELDISLLYTANAFAFTQPGFAHSFFNGLTPKNLALITTFNIDFIACVESGDPDGDSTLSLQWFEYLACPTIHFRTSNNQLCSPARCIHLFYDLPRLRTIVIDTKIAYATNAIAGAMLMNWIQRKPLPLPKPSSRQNYALTGSHGVEVRWVQNAIDTASELWEPRWLCYEDSGSACWPRNHDREAPKHGSRHLLINGYRINDTIALLASLHQPAAISARIRSVQTAGLSSARRVIRGETVGRSRFSHR